MQLLPTTGMLQREIYAIVTKEGIALKVYCFLKKKLMVLRQMVFFNIKNNFYDDIWVQVKLYYYKMKIGTLPAY